MLGRWIYPLEHHVDQLTLKTGQKLEVPFRQMLIVSTNLDPEAVMDPAFLRRMGYRLYVGDPNPAMYERRFPATLSASSISLAKSSGDVL